MNSKVTVSTLQEMKKSGKKIVMLTAYDAAMAKLLNESGIDLILVGDSVANVKLGYENTIPVTVEEMLHHTRAAARGNSRALLVADMPYLSYQGSVEEAKRNAGRFVKEGGAHAVKMEGGREFANTIKSLLEINVPVMGHLGLMPQSIHKIGGFKMQGKTEKEAEKIVTDAKILEGAGAFAIVLECIPAELAKEITSKVLIPTIGIGAGPDCDGQVLVLDDLLGLTDGTVPSFAKKYAHLREEILEAVLKFRNDVQSQRYPEKVKKTP